ncbi:MAG: tyrosine-type recombinase/integrase [Candidatus Curtissbacteria bacterium]|nr:tyrosine-type recombinase/integrase [Candidatus Curtissbacteria bacterium]
MLSGRKRGRIAKKSQIDRFLVRFFDFYRYRGMSEKTIQRNWYNLRHFPDFIDCKHINKDTVRDYILHCKNIDSKSTNGLGEPKGLATASVNSIISSMKQFLKWLWLEEGFLDDDISHCIKSMRLPAFFPDLLTIAEIRTIIDCPREYDRWHNYLDRRYYDFFFELVACTGMRRSETVYLNAGDLDFEEMVIRIREAKFNKPRIIPMPVELGIRLQEWLENRNAKPEEPLFKSFHKDGRRIEAHTFINEMKTRAKILGIKKRVHLHLLRHCFITELIKAEAPALKVARIVGHASLNTTLKYTHLVVDDLKNVIESHPLNLKPVQIDKEPAQKTLHLRES